MQNLIVERVAVGALETNCYLVADKQTKQGIVIDPGDDIGKIRKKIAANALQIMAVCNTHGHFDHIRSDHCFNTPVYIHRQDEVMLRDASRNFSTMFPPVYRYDGVVIPLEDDQTVSFGPLTVRCIHTPGHSPGGMCFLIEDCLFSGDTLFYHTVGRTDITFADHQALLTSLQEKILKLPESTKVYPGHGDPTSIGEELIHNPFTR